MATLVPTLASERELPSGRMAHQPFFRNIGLSGALATTESQLKIMILHGLVTVMAFSFPNSVWERECHNAISDLFRTQTILLSGAPVPVYGGGV